MEDEAFDKFIEYDEDSDSEKENIESKPTRHPRTKRQIDMIAAFIECNNEKLMDKRTWGRLWDDLAARLNDIGPPEHTVTKWRAIWSSHKYHQKLQQLKTFSRSDEPGGAPRLDQSSREVVVVEAVSVGAAAESYKIVPLQSEVSNKLHVIIQNQNAILVNQDVIVHELKILQEIAKQEKK